MQSKKLSVIIAAYNEERTIEKCINKIIDNGYDNIEIIVIDDGSMDRTGEIADFISKENKNVSVYHQKNMGVSSARNHGLSQITGDYFTFVDADDEVVKGFFKQAIDECERDQLDLWVGEIEKVSGSTRRVISSGYNTIVKSDDLSYKLYTDTFWILINCYGKIYKSSSLQHYRFDESMWYAEDAIYVRNIVSIPNLRIKFSPKISILYLWDKNGLSGKVNERVINGEMQFIEFIIKDMGNRYKNVFQYKEFAKLIWNYFVDSFSNGILVLGLSWKQREELNRKLYSNHIINTTLGKNSFFQRSLLVRHVKNYINYRISLSKREN